MMTPECINILHESFNKSKLAGLHDNITPPPSSFAAEVIGLLARKARLEHKFHSSKIKTSYARSLPTHFHHDFQKSALVNKEKMASPLDHNPHYSYYWSSEPRDVLFGALHNALSSKFSGFSICHPIYDENAMTQALRHAIYSATLCTDPTATLMFLPS